ncbi:MAG: hypothetical protein Q8Q76_00585 [Methylotenera sp.]|nr:hypothetical protein [Methylotenera sp.]
MKRFFIATTLALATVTSTAIAADVGVSVSVGQPGFYGRIDVGDYPYPQPRVIYRQPRVIERVVIEREPIYLRAPLAHRQNWGRHCHQYRACGERVYFVRDDWYRHDFAPHYLERHRDSRSDYHHDRNRHHRDQRNDHGKRGHDNHR